MKMTGGLNYLSYFILGCPVAVECKLSRTSLLLVLKREVCSVVSEEYD